LDDNNLTSEEVDLTAQVRFTLNNESEIVVLSVDTENDILASFVKARLNYKKVDVAGVKEGKMFTIPVRIES
jgi:ribosomal protein L7Ae-like RNA K-turn-binding protein